MILLALIWSRYKPSLDINDWIKNTNDESQSVFFGLKVTKYTSSARCILIVRQTRKKVLSQVHNTITYRYKNRRQTKYKYKSQTRFKQNTNKTHKTQDKLNTNTKYTAGAVSRCRLVRPTWPNVHS